MNYIDSDFASPDETLAQYRAVYGEEVDQLADTLEEIGFEPCDILEHAPELVRHEDPLG